MEVIGVGIATVDVIHEVAAYPEEDSKIRSLATRKCRGGNVANALVGEAVCAQLGARCRWLGISTDPAKDSDAAFVHSDLTSFGVDCALAWIEDHGSMPVSYILSSRVSGSRTIVHSRDLPELGYEEFVKQLTLYREQIQKDPNEPMWFHFEGRNLDAADLMMRYIRESMPVASISVEIEALRNDWGSAMKLIFLADYVFISKDYLREKLGFQSAEPFFEAIMSDRWGKMLAKKAKAFICPWGPEGVYYLDMREQIKHHAPAPRIDSVVETIGAGDTFIGASLAGLSGGKVPLDQVVRTACEIASTKCTKRGLAVSNEDKVTWQMQFNCKDESVGANAA